MSKPRLNPRRLRLGPRIVWNQSSPERPLAKLSQAEKRANAIAYLRSRGKYVLDQGAEKPTWGVPSAGAKGKA